MPNNVLYSAWAQAKLRAGGCCFPNWLAHVFRDYLAPSVDTPHADPLAPDNVAVPTGLVGRTRPGGIPGRTVYDHVLD